MKNKTDATIYEINGQWYFLCDGTRTPCDSKRAAKQLLSAHRKFIDKPIVFAINEDYTSKLVVGKCVNVGIMCECDDLVYTTYLFIKHSKEVYRIPAYLASIVKIDKAILEEYYEKKTRKERT